MSIRAIMSTDLVTISTGGNLQEAVTKMLDERVGSVVVQDNDVLTGIITETDVLAVGTTFENPFTEIPVVRAMSSDPVTIEPETSVEETVEMIEAYTIKKLPVVDDATLVGIVTLTDLVYHQQELVEEAKHLERERAAVDRTPP
jgi:CBS domain-containing protein